MIPPEDDPAMVRITRDGVQSAQDVVFMALCVAGLLLLTVAAWVLP